MERLGLKYLDHRLLIEEEKKERKANNTLVLDKEIFSSNNIIPTSPMGSIAPDMTFKAEDLSLCMSNLIEANRDVKLIQRESTPHNIFTDQSILIDSRA